MDRQAGHTPLTGLTLDVSYDDGATWQPSHVVRLGHHGLALLWHPTTAGFVSLRTSARDAAGNTVTQTVLRAYQIR